MNIHRVIHHIFNVDSLGTHTCGFFSPKIPLIPLCVCTITINWFYTSWLTGMDLPNM